MAAHTRIANYVWEYLLSRVWQEISVNTIDNDDDNDDDDGDDDDEYPTELDSLKLPNKFYPQDVLTPSQAGYNNTFSTQAVTNA